MEKLFKFTFFTMVKDDTQKEMTINKTEFQDQWLGVGRCRYSSTEEMTFTQTSAIDAKTIQVT